MDVESFVLILIMVVAFIPFALIDLFRDPEEIAKRIVDEQKFEWRHH
jgi:hypothetical protein